ncbi:MAG: mandelate racemase/muconate lactonizing enzyme family protein [Paracoccus sp. (in: a-proteobacteria)]
MKIIAIEHILLSAPLDERQTARWSGGQMSVANASLVRLRTDSGVDGIGDTYSGGWFYPEASGAVLRHFEPLLLGEDPRNVTLLTKKLVASCKYWGRVGASINAISAIENALWDIAGKAVGLPVWKLVGGLANDALPYYASAGLEKPRDLEAEEMQGYVRDGTRGVKIRVPTDLEAAIAKVARCRELLGPDIDLMVDAVMGSHPDPWDAKRALTFARAIEPFRIAWLEEPCAADDYDGMAEVRAASPIPISGGETLFGLVEFGHLIRKRCVDIVQPDACTSGGIVECQRIAAAAALHGLAVAPHAWGSSAAVMANLHWAFATPNVRLQEFPTWGFPLRDALLTKPLEIRDGCILPPQEPGLGVTLTDELIARYPWAGGTGAKVRTG